MAPPAETADEDIALYSIPVSDCSTRVRIALALKDLRYHLETVSFPENRPDVPRTLNPSQTVPTLVHHRPVDGGGPLTLTQSIAALEYLDDAFPLTMPLLPQDPRQRAQVRTLMNIIATDIHPLTTWRVREAIISLFPCESSTGAAQTGNRSWDLHWIRRGLRIYEELVSETMGVYSVGDVVTMADVCLVPELWTAQKFGVELEEFPRIRRIYQSLMEIDAIRNERPLDAAASRSVAVHGEAEGAQ